MANDYYNQYVQYIKNAGGGGPVKIKHFDEDWEPIGPALRKDMLKLGLIIPDGPNAIRLPDPQL